MPNTFVHIVVRYTPLSFEHIFKSYHYKFYFEAETKGKIFMNFRGFLSLLLIRSLGGGGGGLGGHTIQVYYNYDMLQNRCSKNEQFILSMVSNTLNITTVCDWLIFGAVSTFSRNILHLRFQIFILKETYSSGHKCTCSRDSGAGRGGGFQEQNFICPGWPITQHHGWSYSVGLEFDWSYSIS